MKRVPDLVFVVDVSREETAIHEANLTGIPVIAMVDTNCNPQGVDYVIPSNDDAIRAIKLLVAKIADAVIEGKASRKEDADMVEDASTREVTAAAAVRHPVVDLSRNWKIKTCSAMQPWPNLCSQNRKKSWLLKSQ